MRCAGQGSQGAVGSVRQARQVRLVSAFCAVDRADRGTQPHVPELDSHPPDQLEISVRWRSGAAVSGEAVGLADVAGLDRVASVVDLRVSCACHHYQPATGVLAAHHESVCVREIADLYGTSRTQTIPLQRPRHRTSTILEGSATREWPAPADEATTPPSSAEPRQVKEATSKEPLAPPARWE